MYLNAKSSVSVFFLGHTMLFQSATSIIYLKENLGNHQIYLPSVFELATSEAPIILALADLNIFHT